MSTKDEALSALCEMVCAHRSVPDTFRALVDRRERLAQTSFGNLVAMPHPAEPVSDTTFVAVGLLEHPIAWNEQEVQAIFLVSIAKSRDNDLDPFYRGMARLLGSKPAIQKLVAHQDYGTLLDLLQEYGTILQKE